MNISRKDFLTGTLSTVALAAASSLPIQANEEEAKTTPQETEEVQYNNDVADVLVLGNVITMDENRPFAEAVAITDDKIIYVGAADVARSLCDDHTQVFDYGTNSVYPGFLEAHCHPGGAGHKMVSIARFTEQMSLAECVEVMREYAEAHPEMEVLSGAGFSTSSEMPNASMLDEISTDHIILCTSSDGHSMWINHKAMETYGINKEAVEKWGTACVRVDEDGNPTGYISEAPVFYIRSLQTISVDVMKKDLLAWQDYALSMGYTGVYNAGVELTSKNEPLAYYELEKEGKLKHYTLAGSLLADNTETPEEDVERVAKEAKEHDSKHYKILGIKVFADGVVEAHTAFLLDEYKDQPGYYGVSRFVEHDKMVRLLKAATSHGFNVHVHSIGDAATKAWIDAIVEAEEDTRNFDMRNCLAHLHIVREEDIKRLADYNIIPCTGMMWVEKEPNTFEQEVAYVGEKKAYEAYPIKSFVDCGAVVVSHSDYPVSPSFSAPWTICFGSAGYLPSHGEEVVRHPEECLSRKDTLKALTINVAYSWHQEDLMGSLEIGKLANITVFDKDFLNDDLAEVENAKCLATFVDGVQVYKA